MIDWLIAFYGWVFVNLLILVIEKDEKDEKRVRFKFKTWWKYHWDNLSVTLLAIPLVVLFTDDLWRLLINNYLEKDWEYNRMILLGTVPIVHVFYIAIRKLYKLHKS